VQRICAHERVYGVSSGHDRQRGILAFVLTCERCGTELRELRREPYRPHSEPNGSDRSLAARAGRLHGAPDRRPQAALTVPTGAGTGCGMGRRSRPWTWA
jgi:hypothetical protein